jgi:hypothetical protein
VGLRESLKYAVRHMDAPIKRLTSMLLVGLWDIFCMVGIATHSVNGTA